MCGVIYFLFEEVVCICFWKNVSWAISGWYKMSLASFWFWVHLSHSLGSIMSSQSKGYWMVAISFSGMWLFSMDNSCSKDHVVPYTCQIFGRGWLPDDPGISFFLFSWCEQRNFSTKDWGLRHLPILLQIYGGLNESAVWKLQASGGTSGKECAL